MAPSPKPHGTPTLLYGTGFLGTPTTFPTPEQTNQLLTFLQQKGISRIDTARRYPATVSGLAEQLLGSGGASKMGFIIDTKVKVTGTEGPAGSLTPEKIAASIEESYAALQLPKGTTGVNMLYPHMPDPVTPIADSARGFNDAHKTGKFRGLGLSNYTSAQIEEWLSVCEKEGYIKPTTYQGQYNAFCRRMEEDGLLALLRKNGIAFNAYSPLAGGFLTGKLTAGQTAGTRFEEGNKMGAVTKNCYDKPVMHDAVRKLVVAIEPLGSTLSEASMRWLMHHSALGEGDGVILGGSSLEPIGRNVEDATKGPLPDEIVEIFEEAWKSIREEAP